jgi:hypothetical protein
MTGKLLQPSSSWKGLNFEFLSFLGPKFEMLDFNHVCFGWYLLFRMWKQVA